MKLVSFNNFVRVQEKVELVVPPERAEVGEALVFDGVAGGPFQPVTAAQMEKKKVLDRVLPVRLVDFSQIIHRSYCR